MILRIKRVQRKKSSKQRHQHEHYHDSIICIKKLEHRHNQFNLSE